MVNSAAVVGQPAIAQFVMGSISARKNTTSSPLIVPVLGFDVSLYDCKLTHEPGEHTRKEDILVSQ